MGKFVVGQPKPAAGRSIAMRPQQQQRAKPQVKKMDGGIRIAQRPRPPQGPMPQQGLGGANGGRAGAADGAILHCKKCGKGVYYGSTAMMTQDNEGPFCPDCWVDLWVDHPWANRQEHPPCRMGVRFTNAERAEVQGVMWSVYQAVAPARRFPSLAEMDAALGQVKKSNVCRTCHENIPYSLEAKDFKIAGVTPGIAWPPGLAYPWDQIGQPGQSQGMAGQGYSQHHGHHQAPQQMVQQGQPPQIPGWRPQR